MTMSFYQFSVLMCCVPIVLASNCKYQSAKSAQLGQNSPSKILFGRLIRKVARLASSGFLTLKSAIKSSRPKFQFQTVKMLILGHFNTLNDVRKD